MDFAKADRTLRTLKPKDRPYVVALGDGIECRVTTGGVRVLELRSRIYGRLRRWQLGFYPAMTVSQAFEKAVAYKAALKSGLDPKVHERRANDDNVPRLVRDAAERFITDHLKDTSKVRDRWAKESERIIRVEILPAIGRFPLVQLQRSDLTGIVDRKAVVLRKQNKKGVGANRVAAVISKMFGWIASKGWMADGLATKLPRPAAETAKKRVLTPQEAGEMWELLSRCAAGDGPLNVTHANVLRLLALTGCRASEITNLTLDRVDLKKGLLILTGGKNEASERNLPLTPLARSVIEAQLAQPRGEGNNLLFPSVRRGTVIASNDISHSTTSLLKVLEHKPAWTAHDLRRSFVSILVDAGIDGDTRRRLSGHAAQDIHASVYDRGVRLEAFRAALLTVEGWYSDAAAKAASSTATTNVVNLNKRGA